MREPNRVSSTASWGAMETNRAPSRSHNSPSLRLPNTRRSEEEEPAPQLQIAPNDPIVAYFASASGVVEIDKLDLHSPALKAMKEAQIKVVVPLVSQGS